MNGINFAMRDAESGEIAKERVIVLRKNPHSSSLPSLKNNCRNSLINAYPLLRERQLYRGFRIQDALERIKQGQRNRSRIPYFLTYREFAELAYREGSVEKSLFRVPPSCLPEVKDEKPQSNPNTVCISIWKEFYYGTSALDRHVKANTLEDGWYEYFAEKGDVLLRRWFSRTTLTVFKYTVFFLVYFYSILVYNMFLHLIGYILLARHLKIHERAYENNLDLAFTGSLFQGPTYACVRTWCCHCIQGEHAKIVMSLMKKMKKDIQERQIREESKTV